MWKPQYRIGGVDYGHLGVPVCRPPFMFGCGRGKETVSDRLRVRELQFIDQYGAVGTESECAVGGQGEREA